MTPPRAATHAPRRPVPAPERPVHLRVVPGGSAPGRRPKRWPLVVLAIAAVFSLVQSAVIAGQASIQQGQVERRIVTARTQLAEVELNLVEAMTPESLAKRARQLGMVFPTEVGVMPVRDGKRSGR